MFTTPVGKWAGGIKRYGPDVVHNKENQNNFPSHRGFIWLGSEWALGERKRRPQDSCAARE